MPGDDGKENQSKGGNPAGGGNQRNRRNRPARNRKREKDLMLKAVIRHLPPSMTEDEFKAAVDPLPDNKYFKYCTADHSLGQHAFCRAYISFVKQDDIILFRDKFDGYVFVDSKGNEFPAIVEFAPNQKIPRKKGVSINKNENKTGTLENDSEYLKFLESLKEPKTEVNLPSAEIYLEEMEAREKELKANHGCPKMTTPLIEYIKQKKLSEKMKQREDRRDNRMSKSNNQSKEERMGGNKSNVQRDNFRDTKAKAQIRGPKESSDRNKRDTDSNNPQGEKQNREKQNQQKQQQKNVGPNEPNKNKNNGDGNKRRERNRDNRDKKKKPNDNRNSNNNNEQNVRVLQKNLDELKESNKSKESVSDEPKAGPSAEKKDSSVTISHQKKSRDDPGSEKKQTSQNSSASHEAQHAPSSSERKSSDKKQSFERKERRREPKERIKNKDRPAIEIYRPAAKRQPADINPNDCSKKSGDERDIPRDQKKLTSGDNQNHQSYDDKKPKSSNPDGEISSSSNAQQTKSSPDHKKDPNKIRPMVFRNRTRNSS